MIRRALTHRGPNGGTIRRKSAAAGSWHDDAGRRKPVKLRRTIVAAPGRLPHCRGKGTASRPPVTLRQAAARDADAIAAMHAGQLGRHLAAACCPTVFDAGLADDRTIHW